MVSQAVRAVYEDGRLRVLDPVDLTEGEQVQLMIIDEQGRTRLALGDLLVENKPDIGDAVDEAALQAEIDAALHGEVSVSDAIVQERQDGP
jgi:predicted DNA-binding antitoxin AbrB/MazE fold protein